jgi:hypothetical protein
MYPGCMFACGGMLARFCCWGRCCGVGSSGESTAFESSTPFSPLPAGSGAFKHAWSSQYALRNQLATVTYLDKVLPLSLGDERLELGCRKCVDQASLGDNEQENLGAGEYREFVCLRRDISKGFVKQRQGLVQRRNVASVKQLILTFFMMPAFLLENVM